MNLRRIACLLLGAWLAGALVIGWVATANFAAADRVLTLPPAEIQKATAALGPEHARMYLRYLVAVENSDYFMSWELAEFALLALLGATLLGHRQTRLLTALPVCAFLLVIFQHFRLTPEIIWLGQAMVLAAGSASAQQRGQFRTIHEIYGAIEIVKLLLGVVLGVWLIAMKSRRKGSRAASEDSSEKFDRRYAT